MAKHVRIGVVGAGFAAHFHLASYAKVYGEDFESDPDYQSGQTDFWCLMTFKAIGPDGDGASLETCRSTERTCYREY